MNEIPNHYEPKEIEDRIYKYWQDNQLFSAKVNPAKKPFCIVIPPPNVTGILHMGHALNNTCQDILIRLKRMQGFASLWMPGTDHAGIATQNVVERQLAKEGLKRQDLGREKFLERVWLWREQYGLTIIHQLKKLGASCDWARERFTMDGEYSEAVKEVFIRLYQKDLIYRGNYIINWCPRCQTALSDEEAPHREVEGKLYYIRYPIRETRKGNIPDFIVVATTRPETILGDTAVAVNPKDKRYKNFIGQTVIPPLVEREIKIIADDMVDMKFGTGAVKVTPAHDPNDYALGKKHNLDFINIMNYDGTLNFSAGEYQNMDRFEAREAIIEDLNERKLFEKIEPHKHSVAHCYRCHTVVEPYLSWQWFVRMKPLAKPAIEAVKNSKIKFYPKRWTKVYLNWMENIRDWCISRQIWWGHRIPVWYCRDCGLKSGKIVEVKSGPPGYTTSYTILDSKPLVGYIRPDKCPDCNSANLLQDEDVLDTWFSSWLWPFATFGWPTQSNSKATQRTQELKYFYPTSVLVTAPEIIFFWVARMIMAGFEFIGKEPFKDVYIHGTVRDIEGKKMSKSLGNIIDPLEIIAQYGADALRFSLISITSTGQDVYLSEEKFELGRNFANKLWNASRFSLMNLDLSLVNIDLCVFFEKEKLELPERWILSKFYSILGRLNKALDNFRFNQAANILYEFIWHEFCDWYLELAKPILVTRSPGYQVTSQSKNTQIVLYKVLEKTLRCLHPFMPFITEEIWQKLRATSYLPAGRQASAGVTSIMTQPWPHIQKQMVDKDVESRMQLAIDLITAIRNLKSQVKLPQSQNVKVTIVVKDKKTVRILDETSKYISYLAKLDNLDIRSERPAGIKSISSIFKKTQVLLELEGVIDIEKEIEKLAREIGAITADLKSKESRLKNKEFLQKAPQEVIEREKELVTVNKEKLAASSKILDELKK